VIPVVPPHVATIEYVNDVHVNFGAPLSPGQVMDPPSLLTWPTTSENDLYTLLMLDPDAPARHKPRPGAGLHWMVVNIPGTHVDQGTHLARYLGAGPPENSGLHRYVFAVYKQGGRVDIQNKNVAKKWSLASRGGQYVTPLLQSFIEAGGVSMEPIALNWFNAGYDEYVPICIRRELGHLGFLTPLLLWLAKSKKQS